jgi:hypothetical protein
MTDYQASSGNTLFMKAATLTGASFCLIFIIISSLITVFYSFVLSVFSEFFPASVMEDRLVFPAEKEICLVKTH